MDSQDLDNPFLQSLGMRLAHWSEGRVEFHLPMVPRLGNRSGRLQGGVLCTLLDACGGYAGLYAPPGAPVRHAVTLSLTTQFLDSRPGSLLIARGRVEKQGRSVYFSRSEVWMDDECLLATAVGTFKYLKTPGG